MAVFSKKTLTLFGEYIFPGYYQPGEMFACQRFLADLFDLIVSSANAFDSVIRPSFGSKVIAILVPVKDVSVTLICFLHFYFEPCIF